MSLRRLIVVLLVMVRLVHRGPRPPSPPGSGFERAIRRGYAEVYSVVIAERVIAAFGGTRRLGWYSALLLLAVSSWPCYLNLLLLLVAPRMAVGSRISWLLLAGLSVLSAVMLLAALAAWTYMYRNYEHLDALLARSPDRDVVVNWLHARIGHRRQAVAPVFAVLFGLVFLRLETHRLSLWFDIGLSSYLCLAWTAFLGGSVCYWLFVMPGGVRRIYLCRDLSVRWQDPATSPGLRIVAEGFWLSALFLLAGVAIVTVLSFWEPGLFGIPPMRFLLVVLFALFVVLSFRVGVYAHVWVYAIIRRAKFATLDLIQVGVADISRITPDGMLRDVSAWVTMYREVGTASHLPFSTSVVVQYSAALLGAVLAFGFQQLTQ